EFGTNLHNFRYNAETWRDANSRNTKPDFVADAVYSKMFLGIYPYGKIYTVRGGSAFEVKQKGGGIYLSTSSDQIRGHLDNIASRFAKDIANGFTPSFTLITTAD